MIYQILYFFLWLLSLQSLSTKFFSGCCMDKFLKLFNFTCLFQKSSKWICLAQLVITQILIERKLAFPSLFPITLSQPCEATDNHNESSLPFFHGLLYFPVDVDSLKLFLPLFSPFLTCPHGWLYPIFKARVKYQ